ncbi:2-hydroxyacid dehydrogenase [Actinoalloteichus hymeniacidonis]|uniref:Phosphoglycerate dehydrogenase-like oxidoreductase n=1 Tax=Actinoalloteichus hymeniacidonis TaxID=340345 RepID=A0AAC9HSA3_9PSEU|nr:2-hydroxyacid dehydrogenase [Actinoalloteichus hymeniacidonis]AOS64737.1 phosphoglycerate dehydrogenase-like oxidoreductase [Actinoalloteichus hymeniacidonis]MBB5907187.1 phosphoglycerate dehydrogenase-like enzyme [Actinoalloteichus hymeniacidonis]
MKIVLTDPVLTRFFTPELTSAGADGHDWRLLAGRPDDEVAEELADADVLVASRMTPEMARRAGRLRLVHVTGAGYDRIPLDALAPGVTVCNTFHHGRSIAEHVVMVTMMLSRRVLPADRRFRAGEWRSVVLDDSVPLGVGLAGRTVGVVGLGEIGQQVVRATTALGMRARAVRRNPQAPLPDDLRLDHVGGDDELDALLGASDVVVITVPLSTATTGLIDADRIAAMRPTALLVNVARGPIVDEDALYAALEQRRIGGAALDVWWSHPKDGVGTRGHTRPFDGLDNVVLTPHHSGHTAETFGGRAAEIAANIARLAEGAPLTNVVRAGE